MPFYLIGHGIITSHSGLPGDAPACGVPWRNAAFTSGVAASSMTPRIAETSPASHARQAASAWQAGTGQFTRGPVLPARIP